jgi:probable rRNA maturation factor
VSERKRPRVLVRLPTQSRIATAVRYKGPKAAALRRIVLHTLERVAPQVVGEVGVVITDDTAIRGLNRRFRAKDAATDVLAFPLSEGLRADEPYGDVVISYETARRQARAYGAPLGQEMARLLIHGTLHLCGHDHHERAQAAHMYGLTRRLLREVTANA